MALVEMSVVEQRYRAGTRYAGFWRSMVRLVGATACGAGRISDGVTLRGGNDDGQC
jgi:hypothetical protein